MNEGLRLWGKVWLRSEGCFGPKSCKIHLKTPLPGRLHVGSAAGKRGEWAAAIAPLFISTQVGCRGVGGNGASGSSIQLKSKG